MKKVIFISAIAGMTGAGISGCYYDNSEELYPQPDVNRCDTMNITYTATLKPIIDQQCATAGCHAGFAPTGIDLRGYTGLRAIADNGRLMVSINHTGAFPMPKGMPKMDPCTIAKFQAWINNNKPE